MDPGHRAGDQAAVHHSVGTAERRLRDAVRRGRMDVRRSVRDSDIISTNIDPDEGLILNCEPYQLMTVGEQGEKYDTAVSLTNEKPLKSLSFVER